MTKTIYNNLKNWIVNLLGNIDVVPSPPSTEITDKISVSLYLKNITKSRSTGSRPVKNNIQLTLSFLVTVNSKNMHDINNLITALTLSAISKEDIEIDFTGLSPSEWLSFGIVPRPSLLINVPLNCKTEVQDVKLVEKPMIIKSHGK